MKQNTLPVKLIENIDRYYDSCAFLLKSLTEDCSDEDVVRYFPHIEKFVLDFMKELSLMSSMCRSCSVDGSLEDFRISSMMLCLRNINSSIKELRCSCGFDCVCF